MHKSVARVGGLVAAVAAGALVLAACGSGTPAGSGSTTSPTTPSANGSSTSSTGPASSSSTSAPSSGDAAAAIATALQNGENATFDATYKVVGSSSVSTFEIATESSTKFAWVVTESSGSKSEFIGNGSNAWACTIPSSGAATCVQYPVSDISTLSAAYAIFTGKYWYDDVTAIKQYSGLAGFHESTSSSSYAGQSANCVTWTGGTAGTTGSGGQVCVTSQGVLAYAKANNTPDSITLQSLNTSVSSSMFSPPSGATVQTIPGGSIP